MMTLEELEALEAALENSWVIASPTEREAFELIVVAARHWLMAQKAIANEGPKKYLHRRVMARHQAEWPTLWEALDAR